MVFKQSGNSVTGTYTHDQGRFSGTVKGNALSGRWNEVPTRKPPNDAGLVEWTLAADGKSFTGKWRYGFSGPLDRTDWPGTCTGGACRSNSGAAQPPTATATGPGGWSHLGTGGAPATSGLNGSVHALDADTPGTLYAGGRFTDAGGDRNADRIARWNAGSWKALGVGPQNGVVHAIASRGNRVYIGGIFTNVGGNADLDSLAMWNGTSWGPVCNTTGPTTNGLVLALEIVGSTIYIGGAFQNGAGIAAADYLLACDLNTGVPRATVGPDRPISGPVYALTSDSRGALYAGGSFSDLAGIPEADKVAYLNGSGWHAMGSGPGPGKGAIDGVVRALATSGANVYVGGDSVNIAGIPQADHVARWNGSAWSAMGSNTGGRDGWFPAPWTINALATSGSRVFAGGAFTNANGDRRADYIAVFDGRAWGPVGSNGAGDGALNEPVNALATQGTLLYAGGFFSNAGGNALADFVASIPVAGAPGGGGPPPTTTGPPTTTTTPGGGGAAPPPSATATGTVLVNGRPFASGTIPYGSTVDVTRGRLVLRADTGTLTVNGAGGISAVFVLRRGTDRRRPIVELRLTRGNFSVCPARRTNSASQTPSTTVRQLWGNGKGRFRTRGRYAAATVRGTNWLTADRCNGTFVRVRQGVIGVLDPPRRQEITLRAPRTYLARP
jgi:hypothetical protein